MRGVRALVHKVEALRNGGWLPTVALLEVVGRVRWVLPTVAMLDDAGDYEGRGTTTVLRLRSPVEDSETRPFLFQPFWDVARACAVTSRRRLGVRTVEPLA